MEQLRPDFDIVRLQQMIDTVGMQVDREPENTAARLRLAWCFLGRALYRVGQTSVAPIPPLNDVDSDCDAMELLKKSLHQVSVVRQLSLESHEQQEAQMLYSLIGMASGHEMIQKSEEAEETTLQKLMLSLQSQRLSRSSLEPRLYPRRHFRR